MGSFFPLKESVRPLFTPVSFSDNILLFLDIFLCYNKERNVYSLVVAKMDNWIEVLGQACLQFFLHPLVYLYLFCSLILGYFRVKKERRMFSTRIYDVIFEIKDSIVSGFVVGLGLSIILVGLGLTLPKEVVFLVGSVSILGLVLLQTRMMSLAYVMGIALLIPACLSILPIKIAIPFVQASEVNIGNIALFVGLFVLAEGILIWWNGSKGTTPSLKTGKRGKKVGSRIVNRFWFVPVFLWIPGSDIPALFSWWPTFSVGNEAYTLMLFPFVLGFFSEIAGTLPKEKIVMTGQRVLVLGIGIILLGITGIWFRWVGLFAIVLAIILRYSITYLEKLSDERKPAYFSAKNNGLIVLGVIPKSPGEKMGLRVGDTIVKVNGENVHTIDEFYVALQKNGAHCKLDVLDTNGELRFVQRALYQGEHHELGVLFADEHIPLPVVEIGNQLNM